MKKVKIYYIRHKGTDPNQRWYYISNYIGMPFFKFECGFGSGYTFEQEKMDVAEYLGLRVNQINFLKRGKGK
jgi:hypothetical protein